MEGRGGEEVARQACALPFTLGVTGVCVGTFNAARISMRVYRGERLETSAHFNGQHDSVRFFVGRGIMHMFESSCECAGLVGLSFAYQALYSSIGTLFKLLVSVSGPCFPFSYYSDCDCFSSLHVVDGKSSNYGGCLALHSLVWMTPTDSYASS